MEARRREDFCLAPLGWTDSEDDEDDQFSAELLEAFLATNNTPPINTPPTKQDPPPAKQKRFGDPLTLDDVAQATKAAVPKKTQQDTRWCVGIWNEWCEQRPTSSSEPTPVKLCEDSSKISIPMLSRGLPLFILEARKLNGKRYPPDTLHHIICGIFRFVRLNGNPEVDFFKDKQFTQARSVLDSEMKQLKGHGIGSIKRKVEPLTVEEEEILWNKGILGYHSPQALLNTVFFFKMESTLPSAVAVSIVC